MAFKFRLEKLLNVRKQERDKKFILWQSEHEKLEKLKSIKKQINIEFKENKERYTECYKKKDMQGLMLFKMYLSTFKFKMSDVENKIADQKGRIEEFRLNLLDSNIKYETLKKLKVKKKDEYLKIIKKQEEKEIDELNILRSKRGNQVGSL